MITCIAIDDEPLALELIEKYCSEVPFLQLQRTFTKISEATRYVKKFPTDLLFLDIEMPDMSGIDFYKSISQNTMVIFTTAFSEYAVEGFDLNALDYLLKPFEFGRFVKAVNKARDYQEYQKQSGRNTAHIFVRSEYSLMKILLSDILYIETLDDYLKIHLVSQKPIITLMNLKAMEEKLSSDEFVRVHRSYIVALSRITSIRNKMISLGNIEIPIGVTYESDFFDRYSH